MIQSIFRTLILLCASFLVGCAANQMPGFQNTYYSYNVPQPLLDQITVKFKEHGLVNARIARDSVGRVQLKGSYKNEEDVDTAFIIVQDLVGLKSTSPFYPNDIKVKRWEIEAGKALSTFSKDLIKASPPKKYALIIGINTFRDSKNLAPIFGEDDAKVVIKAAAKARYAVTALLGNNATKSNIESELENIKNKVRPNDSLFIYISSHGTMPLPSNKGGDQRKMSIAAWDSSLNGNDSTDQKLNFHRTAVSDTLVQDLVKKETKNTRIFIDTCYSGEILDNKNNQSSAYVLKTNGGQPERAGVAISSWTGEEFTSKGIHFSEDTEVLTPTQANDKKLQRVVRQAQIDRTRADYTFITATSANEKSWGPDKNGVFLSNRDPGKKLKGSFFTQFFFESLDVHNGQIEIAFKEAQDQTTQKVSAIPGPPYGPGPVHQVPLHYSTVSADKNNLNQ